MIIYMLLDEDNLNTGLFSVQEREAITLLVKEETHHTHSRDSRSPVCSTTPASPHIYTQEAAGHTSSGYTLQSQKLNHHISQMFLKYEMSPRIDQ